MEKKLRLKEFTGEEIINLLRKIGNRLREGVTIFMIGGGGMSLKGIKAITLDIDLIVLTKKEYKNLKKILIGLGYECHEEILSENFYKTPIIVFLKNDKRIDIFIRNVSNQLELSKEMQKRSQEYAKLSNLIIKLVSNEDIFLFKSITDREKDVDDCRTLIVGGLNWEVIKKELHNQEGKALWRFWLYEQLCRIRNKYGAVIPKEIFDYVWDLAKKKWFSKPTDFMEGIEDERFEKFKRKKRKNKRED